MQRTDVVALVRPLLESLGVNESRRRPEAQIASRAAKKLQKADTSPETKQYFAPVVDPVRERVWSLNEALRDERWADVPVESRALVDALCVLCVAEAEFFGSRQFSLEKNENGNLRTLQFCKGEVLHPFTEKVHAMSLDVREKVLESMGTDVEEEMNEIDDILTKIESSVSLLVHFEAADADAANKFFPIFIEQVVREFTDLVKAVERNSVRKSGCFGFFSKRKDGALLVVKRRTVDSVLSLAQAEVLFCFERMGLATAHIPGTRGPLQKRRNANRFTGRRIVVKANGGGEFRDLQKAVGTAEVGDCIILGSGQYEGGIHLEKDISIEGDGDGTRVIIQGKEAPAVYFSGSQGSLKNVSLIQLEKSAHVCVDIAHGVLDLEHVQISASNFLPCVSVHEGAECVAKDCRLVEGRSAGFLFYDSAGGSVENTEICGLTKAGVEIEGGANPLIRNNRIHDNNSAGIFVHSGGRGMIIGNDIYGNTLSGLEIRSKGNPCVRQNSIHSQKKGSGIYVSEDGLGEFTENDIYENCRAGLEVRAGGNPTVVGNTFRNGIDCGILVHENGQGFYEANDIFSNDLAGIEVRTRATPNFVNNTIHKCPAQGVFFCDNARGSLIGNEIFGCQKAAVEVRIGSTPSISKNRIHHTKDCGISVYENSGGTIDQNEIFWARCGIEVRARGNPKILSNRITDCKGAGVYIFDEGLGVLESNHISLNARAGVEVRGRSSVTLVRNEINHCSGSGVFVYEEGTVVTCEECSCIGNKMNGVEVRLRAKLVCRSCALKGNHQYGGCSRESGSLSMTDCDIDGNSSGAYSTDPGDERSLTVSGISSGQPVVLASSARPAAPPPMASAPLYEPPGSTFTEVQPERQITSAWDRGEVHQGQRQSPNRPAPRVPPPSLHREQPVAVEGGVGVRSSGFGSALKEPLL